MISIFFVSLIVEFEYFFFLNKSSSLIICLKKRSRSLIICYLISNFVESGLRLCLCFCLLGKQLTFHLVASLINAKFIKIHRIRYLIASPSLKVIGRNRS